MSNKKKNKYALHTYMRGGSNYYTHFCIIIYSYDILESVFFLLLVSLFSSWCCCCFSLLILLQHFFFRLKPLSSRLIHISIFFRYEFNFQDQYQLCSLCFFLFSSFIEWRRGKYMNRIGASFFLHIWQRDLQLVLQHIECWNVWNFGFSNMRASLCNCLMMALFYDAATFVFFPDMIIICWEFFWCCFHSIRIIINISLA